MAVTGTITTKFIDEKGVDLGRQLVEKDYLISVYPNLVPQLKSAGLYVCGQNTYGELGINASGTRSSLIQTVAYGNNWKQSAVGNSASAGIKADGTLWVWGGNFYGQLGDNTTTNRSSPIQTIAGGASWQQVSVGGDHIGAIKTDGTLWMWGYNNLGQLGDNTITNKSSPVQTITGGTNWKQVSCGFSHVVALKTDGTLWVWGRNNLGQLGDSTIVHKSSPVQTVALGTNWQTAIAGGVFTGAINTDGSLWLWGANYSGQCADNTSTNRSSPVQTISRGNNWKFIYGGNDHAVSIKTDGSLWLWGGNGFGQLGDNTTIKKSSPIQTISAGNNWKYAAAGSYASSSIKTDGTLWTWGYNFAGQLGDGTTTSRSSPIQTATGGTNWKQTALCTVMMAIRDANY